MIMKIKITLFFNLKNSIKLFVKFIFFIILINIKIIFLHKGSDGIGRHE